MMPALTNRLLEANLSSLAGNWSNSAGVAWMWRFTEAMKGRGGWLIIMGKKFGGDGAVWFR